MNVPSSCFSHEHLHIAWLTWRAENTYTLIMGTARSMSIVPPQLQVNCVLTGCQPSVRHLHKYSYEIQIHRWSSTQQGQENRNEEQWLREEIPGNNWDVVGLTGDLGTENGDRNFLKLYWYSLYTVEFIHFKCTKKLFLLVLQNNATITMNQFLFYIRLSLHVFIVHGNTWRQFHISTYCMLSIFTSTLS